jgi:hypothetical protein
VSQRISATLTMERYLKNVFIATVGLELEIYELSSIEYADTDNED